MAPKVVDKEQRKREIALAALDLFGERGFAATSVSDIARAAQVSKGAIYLYFDSKEHLIIHSIATWVNQIVQDSRRRVPQDLPPPERLRALLHTMVEVFVPDEKSIKIAAAMFQLFVTNRRLFTERGLSPEMFSAARRAIADVLLDGVSQGIFRPEIARDAGRIAINTLGYLDGIALHYYMSKDYFDLADQLDLYVDTLMSTLLAPGARESSP